MRPEDSAALRDLVDRYADAIDRRDAGSLRALFTEEGVLRVQADDGPPESEWTGPDVVESLEAVRGYSGTFHHVGTCVFDAGAAGTKAGHSGPSADATGRVRCLAHHYDRTGNGPVDLVMMIVYHDTYRKQQDGWRIAERRVAIQWTELHPAHPKRRVRT